MAEGDSYRDPLGLSGAITVGSLTPPRDDLEGINAERPAKQRFHIDPPRLSVEEKAKFVARTEEILPSEVEVDDSIHEVIGECTINSVHFYFARYEEGLAHKFPATLFNERFPLLVTQYEKRKKAGTLPPFDPSSHHVHPDSRVTMVMRINVKQSALKTKTRVGSATDELFSPSGESEASSDDDDDDSDAYGESDDSGLKIRISRSRTKVVKKLPFSPRKMHTRNAKRARKVDDGNSDDSVVEVSRSRASARLSARKTRSKNVKYAENHSSDDESESFTEVTAKTTKKGRSRSKQRYKTYRPAYGHVHDIAELTDEDEVEPLSAHRKMCEKCHLQAAHQLPVKKKSRRKKKEEFEMSSDDDNSKLGGWVRCVKCPVAAHWGCLTKSQTDEILRAIKDKDTEEMARNLPQDAPAPTVPRRTGLTIDQATEFICHSCTKGGICIGCEEVALQADPLLAKTSSAMAQEHDRDDAMQVDTDASNNQDGAAMGESSTELLFRCLACKSLSHYKHLRAPSNLDVENGDLVALALHYQVDNSWLCEDCVKYSTNKLDLILAWRPVASKALVTPDETDLSYRQPLARQYLVKWEGKSYRRLDWVPHMWLLSIYPSKLRHFFDNGAKVALLKEAIPDDHAANVVERNASFEEIVAVGVGPQAETTPVRVMSPLDATPDAERKIPPPWKTVEHVLDILLWSPNKYSTKGRNPEKSKRKHIESDEETEDADPAVDAERRAAFELGEQPRDVFTETVEEWEARTGKTFSIAEIDRIVWGFFKWGDLPYDQTTWDSPPLPDEPAYSDFKYALERFIASKKVNVQMLNRKEYAKYNDRPKDAYKRKHALHTGDELELGQDAHLKLMPFQVDGFNWLCDNWWNHQPCILADEMGLGKTVQIATFLGRVVKDFKAMPALVVVPNTTITNWVRELLRWAPNIRAVPLYGEDKCRQVIKRYELFHDKQGNNPKFHVLVTTYETLSNQKEFTSVFKRQPYWEILIVDEGQRLKNDNSLLFKKLNELNCKHRIIMTGTPLNNNIRELFNLMNFLDPNEWSDLQALEKEHESLDEELIKKLHARLRPYFLRRIKSEVLQLPPKNEVIVPLSMAPLQKELYRSIFSRNLNILKDLVQVQNAKVLGSNFKSKKNLNNVLMELRKCLQHPYIVDSNIEPKGLAPAVAHEKLIDGSSKLRFLKTLLPKLKARGHRVLIFSQFVIALNVVEDFLIGEKYKYLRLDGNVKQAQRQKDMDEFNKPDSDIFVYLLTTRAGGVGINLWSADTVIILDPDFNPHQDLQAIARAHRFGQKKTCLVFKLMMKGSAEERITQIGKKKLVLDHLIVQKMDDDDDAGENMQSILTFGAQELFEENRESRDIVYSEHDVDKLIEKTEQAPEPSPDAETSDGAFSFSFAKVWSADKDSLEEVAEGPSTDPEDSWAQTLQRITLENEKKKASEVTGRGARRHANAKVVQQFIPGIDDTPEKPGSRRKRGKQSADSSDEYDLSGHESKDGSSIGKGSDVASMSDLVDDATGRHVSKQRPIQKAKKRRVAFESFAALENHQGHCGLCNKTHGSRKGDCPMTEKSENLAVYRDMLMNHVGDEPDNLRLGAIQAIEIVLQNRGHVHLIENQPLHFVRAPANVVTALPQPRASSSKRAAPVSPLGYQRPRKQHKHKPLCQLCSEYHLLSDCPVVQQGPSRISAEIVRLEDDPTQQMTVGNLKRILTKKTKAKRRAEASASAANRHTDGAVRRINLDLDA